MTSASSPLAKRPVQIVIGVVALALLLAWLAPPRLFAPGAGDLDVLLGYDDVDYAEAVNVNCTHVMGRKYACSFRLRFIGDDDERDAFEARFDVDDDEDRSERLGLCLVQAGSQWIRDRQCAVH